MNEEKRPEPHRTEEDKEAKPRTPVRVKIKRLDRGKEVRTPGGTKGGISKKGTGGKGGKKKESLSPSQRRIENYFLKIKGRPIGLSMRSEHPKPMQGTNNSPLEGVLEVSACAKPSRPGTSPLPVERGGAARGKEEGLETCQGLGEVAPPKLRTPNPDLWSLEPRPQRSSKDGSPNKKDLNVRLSTPSRNVNAC